VKFLFDENLSHRLVERLTDLYPDCVHVRDVGLERAPDEAVWSYARANAFTIVTQDADFGEMSVLLDTPPKVIWLRRGNCSTDEIEVILRAQYEAVMAFHNDAQQAVLALF
jgi:predicted nuclease of predicted toxin-antitoxin system